MGLRSRVLGALGSSRAHKKLGIGLAVFRVECSKVWGLGLA